MVSVSRRSATVLAVAGIAAASTGLWLYAVGGRATAGGFLQYTAVALGTSVLGGFILWHRPRNRYGIAHLALGVLFGSVVFASGVLSRVGTPDPFPTWAEQPALAWSWLSLGALLPLWVIVIATFPDGGFHRRFLKRATVALAAVTTFLAAAAYLLSPAGSTLPLIRIATPESLAGPLAGVGWPWLYQLASVSGAVLGTLAPVGAVVALVDRYRKADAVVRQQIKWLLVGASISVFLQAIPVQAFDSEALRAAARIIVLLAVPLPLVAAGIAIFKYGLWEIDLVISKGLVYTLASAVLSALFLGVALVAGVSVAGRDTRIVGALGLALLVSFLAQPLRQRLETVVARALFGDAPRGLMALSRLGDPAGPVLDARAHGSRIAVVARNALGAPWAGVWLYLAAEGSGSFRALAVSGAEEGPRVLVPDGVARALGDLSGGRLLTDLPSDAADALRPLLADETAVVATLTSKGTLIGLIACGSRARDPFKVEEVELLAALARESALALRNIHLEGELRQRLEQIEQQAAALHRSRQRLVTAQGEERRRIERDLHDGAQQQLVALAARLRRVAHADSHLSRQLTELADRGLHEALKAHAARLPVSVHVEVGPTMLGRRLAPELETALYYVALESMTNAVKHAPGARISVVTRADRSRRSVILEVHDDGPGFAPGSTSGSGIQNMTDRIDAVDGVFSVESVLGAGTWIRAEVAEPAQITGIRSRGETPSGRSGLRPHAG